MPDIKQKQVRPVKMPVLALRDAVVFPQMVIPLFIGRPKSIVAIDHAFETNKKIFLVAQKDSTLDNISTSDLYLFGTICNISQIIKLADGTIKILIEGKNRGNTKKIYEHEEMFNASVRVARDEEISNHKNAEALRLALLSHFEQFARSSKKFSPEVFDALFAIESPSRLAYNIASYMPLKISEKQNLLETNSVEKRLNTLMVLIENQSELLQVEKKIKTRVKRQVEKNQKEYYLNEQLKAIHKELGETEDSTNDLNELSKKIKNSHMTKETMDKALGELKKLKGMMPLSQESGIVRNYIDWLISIPWTSSKKKSSLEYAEKILAESHYGLEKIKERIIEYLAVQERVKKIKGQIMCFVGPPGVGKTSLGKAIASATKKNFIRIALGGVNDEAEIRGHRRTYIGAMPGKIMQAMKKAGVNNPVIMLDEIDKLGNDWRGDPASALLEVLDPEQNSTFTDNYIDTPYDLSNVMFITTANTLDIPSPLMDRMEIIFLSGYTDEEKIKIAKHHIIEKQKKENGLKPNELEIYDDALFSIIRDYTRESGVRNLERNVAKIARKSVKIILTNKKIKKIEVKKENLSKFLGVSKYSNFKIEKEDIVGVVTGLAWTEMGGDLLSIESLLLPGTGNIISTGQLGDVMQESVKAAYSYVKSQSVTLKLDEEMFSKNDVHVHVPEGAVPKDGPSAGVTICTSIVSALTKRKVRHDIAMTGEITLLGKILAIGGLKEKLLAANRGAVKTVFIPKENEKDLVDMPDNLLKSINIKPVSHIKEILDASFIN
ncbi:MAG: endopeptidase La [Holosporales bacterium]|jgi:ATP-dependent Lon protease|nr:endopeptidase La [Holosporales bacterium]